jgi:hypothetical protein
MCLCVCVLYHMFPWFHNCTTESTDRYSYKTFGNMKRTVWRSERYLKIQLGILSVEREKRRENSKHNWIRCHDNDDDGSLQGPDFFYEHVTTDSVTDPPFIVWLSAAACRQYGGCSVKLTIHFHLVPRLGIRGALPLGPSRFSYRA